MRFSAFISLIFFFIFLALPVHHAEVNESEPQPPVPPSQEGPLFARAVYSNGSPMHNSALVLLVRSGKSDTVLRLITDESGRFLLSLGKGAHDIDALLDLPGTPGMDFASTSSFSGDGTSNLTLIFYPAGSLSGKVLQQGAIAPTARVRVSCPSNSFDYVRINGVAEVDAGEAGEFMFRALPAGSCTVSASAPSLANSAEFSVLPGQLTAVVVEMKPKALGPDPIPFAAIAIGAIVLLGMAFLAFRQRFFGKTAYAAVSAPLRPVRAPDGPLPAKAKAKEKKAAWETEETPYSLANPKVKAVLSTLTDREAEITKFLLKCGGRAKRSSMQHKLLIPKTSLLRNLRSLERKNIVKLTPFGRNLLAEISESLFR